MQIFGHKSFYGRGFPADINEDATKIVKLINGCEDVNCIHLTLYFDFTWVVQSVMLELNTANSSSWTESRIYRQPNDLSRHTTRMFRQETATWPTTVMPDIKSAPTWPQRPPAAIRPQCLTSLRHKAMLAVAHLVEKFPIFYWFHKRRCHWLRLCGVESKDN